MFGRRLGVRECPNIFGGLRGGFGDIFGGSPFESFFGGNSSGRSQRKGTDIQIKLPLALEDISAGIEKKVKIKRKTASKIVNKNNEVDYPK